MITSPVLRSDRESGFSLVELMVAVVIGMLAVLVVMQTFSVAEAQKRTTTTGDDAISNGAVAFYTMQRDIRESGFGTSQPAVIGCDVVLRAGVTLAAMAPVTINHPAIPAADAGDTLLVVSGATNGSPEGDGVTAQPASATYAVQTPASYAVNDQVIAAPAVRASPCSLALDKVTSVLSPNVTVAAGAAAMSNGTLFNLGQAPTMVAYAVRGGNLTACDFTANDCTSVANKNNPAVWLPIASNIVALRAEYGRDTSAPMDAIVDTYDQATPTTACGWARVSSLNFSVLARGAQYNKEVVTQQAPTWEGSASYPFDLTATANWQHYRYKVFQSTVPLRNIAWMGVQPGC